MTKANVLHESPPLESYKGGPLKNSLINKIKDYFTYLLTRYNSSDVAMKHQAPSCDTVFPLHRSFRDAQRGNLHAKVLNTTYKFTRELLLHLKEKNIHLFVRIVARLGIQATRHVLKETKTTQNPQAIYTSTGNRRTLGGVFIFLLRQRISHEDIKFIWEEQKKCQTLFKRDKTKVNRLNQLMEACLKLEEPFCDPAKPISGTSLESSSTVYELEEGEI